MSYDRTCDVWYGMCVVCYDVVCDVVNDTVCIVWYGMGGYEERLVMTS